jgi:hypothetical protein
LLPCPPVHNTLLLAISVCRVSSVHGVGLNSLFQLLATVIDLTSLGDNDLAALPVVAHAVVPAYNLPNAASQVRTSITTRSLLSLPGREFTTWLLSPPPPKRWRYRGVVCVRADDGPGSVCRQLWVLRTQRPDRDRPSTSARTPIRPFFFFFFLFTCASFGGAGSHPSVGF